MIGLTAGMALTQQVTPPTGQKEIDKKRSAELFNGQTMFQWTTDLRDKDPSVRLKAIAALKFYGSAAREAVPRLLEALSDRDASIRVNAIITLGFVGLDERDKATGIAKLTTLLGDHEGIVRYQAVTALNRLGPSANSAVQRVGALAHDRASMEVRRAAMEALGSIGFPPSGADPKAFPGLFEGLNDSASEVRHQALISLYMLGRPPSAVEKSKEDQMLVRLFNDKREVISIWARVVWMRNNSVTEDHLSKIAKSLHSQKSEARIDACRALATIGTDAKGKVDDLVMCLDDKDPNVIAWAIVAIAQMQDAGKRVIGSIKKLTNHQDEVVKRAANEAVSRLGG